LVGTSILRAKEFPNLHFPESPSGNAPKSPLPALPSGIALKLAVESDQGVRRGMRKKQNIAQGQNS
jgi:hypothetical protein